MKDFWNFYDTKEKIFIFGYASIVLLIIIFIFIAVKAEFDTWNDGFCECGGRWEYVTSTDHVYTTSSGYQINKGYIYKCNKCGKMHEFNELR